MNNIDFKGIAEAALNAAASLLSEWLPDGVLDGHEFVALNPNRADKKRGSFRININTGRWADFAIDKTGSDLISLYSYVFSCNQGEAAKAISKRLSLGGFETHNVPKMKTNKKNKNDNWETVMPVPEFAVKSMDFKFYTNKQAAMTSVFKDANGAVLCGSARFINSDGSKEDLPYTFCRNKQTGMQMWRWRGVDGLRPIYGLDAVANNPNALVLVVEGEKCKQKSDLQGLPYAVITWHGGGKAVNKVDWSAITNRRVVLWADADLQANKANDGLIPMTEQVGVKAMQWLAERLQSQGCDVRGINVYGLMPQNAGGWDIADALDDVDFGGRERIIKLVDAAPSWHANLAAMEIDFKNHFFNATPPAPTINSSIENVTNPAQDNLPAQEQEGKGGIETPEQKLVTLKLKFCLVEGKNSAVNKTTGVQYSRTALIAHFGKEAVDAWYEWGKARVLTMFEINKIKKKYEREHEDELLKEDKEYIDMMERYIYLDGSSSIWDNKLWRMIDQGAAKLAMGDSFKIWVNSPNRRVIPLDNIVFSPDEEVSAEKINLYRGLPMMDKLVFPMPKEDMPQNTFEVLSLFPQCQNIQRLVTHCDGWYLLTPNTPADKVDFYVYRQAQTAEATERYGLNIYDAKGKLQYHSGWNILRAHTIIEPKNPSVNNGEGWTNWQGIKLFKVRGGAQEMHIDDYMKYQAGYIHVGENKLVNIGYFQSFSFHSRDARSFWGQGKGYLAPFLHQGRLSLSLAHIESAGGTPDRFFGENQFPQNQMPLHIYNPILVIEKPRI